MTAIGADLAIQTRSAEPRPAARAAAPMSFADMIAPGERAETPRPARATGAERADGRKPSADRGEAKRRDGDDALPVVADAAPHTPTTTPADTLLANPAAPATVETAAALGDGPTEATEASTGVGVAADAASDNAAIAAMATFAAAASKAPVENPAGADSLPAPLPGALPPVPPAPRPTSDGAIIVPPELLAPAAEDLARLTGSRPATGMTVTDMTAGLTSQPGAMRVGGTPVLPSAGDGPPQERARLEAGSPAPVVGGPQPGEGGEETAETVRFAVRQPTSSAAGTEPAPPSGETAQPSLLPTATAGDAEIDRPALAARETAPLHRHLPSQAILDQVAVHVSKAARDGVDSIRIQLHPAALGHLEVNLDVSADGRVTATVTADNQDTLDLLQRDARGLERALYEAGLKTDAGSLSFHLRGEQRAGHERGQARGSGQRGRSSLAAARDALPPAISAAASAAGGIDIRV